jgi:predicted small metal-binding protein
MVHYRRQKNMAVMLRCADGGADCPFEVKTEKESELLEHAQLHMASAHPELAKNPPTPAQIKAMIHQV